MGRCGAREVCGPLDQCSRVQVLALPTLDETPGLPGIWLLHLQPVVPAVLTGDGAVRATRGDVAKMPLTLPDLGGDPRGWRRTCTSR